MYELFWVHPPLVRLLLYKDYFGFIPDKLRIKIILYVISNELSKLKYFNYID